MTKAAGYATHINITHTHMTLRSTHAHDKTLIGDRPRHNCVALWTAVHPACLCGHTASSYTGPQWVILGLFSRPSLSCNINAIGFKKGDRKNGGMLSRGAIPWSPPPTRHRGDTRISSAVSDLPSSIPRLCTLVLQTPRSREQLGATAVYRCIRQFSLGDERG
jgi:hypothetical protein